MQPTGKTRSFDGCNNCKDGRIKCDRQKPVCSICQRRGLSCDYSLRLKWVDNDMVGSTFNPNQEYRPPRLKRTRRKKDSKAATTASDTTSKITKPSRKPSYIKTTPALPQESSNLILNFQQKQRQSISSASSAGPPMSSMFSVIDFQTSPVPAATKRTQPESSIQSSIGIPNAIVFTKPFVSTVSPNPNHNFTPSPISPPHVVNILNAGLVQNIPPPNEVHTLSNSLAKPESGHIPQNQYQQEFINNTFQSLNSILTEAIPSFNPPKAASSSQIQELDENDGSNDNNDNNNTLIPQLSSRRPGYNDRSSEVQPSTKNNGNISPTLLRHPLISRALGIASHISSHLSNSFVNDIFYHYLDFTCPSLDPERPNIHTNYSIKYYLPVAINAPAAFHGLLALSCLQLCFRDPKYGDYALRHRAIAIKYLSIDIGKEKYALRNPSVLAAVLCQITLDVLDVKSMQWKIYLELCRPYVSEILELEEKPSTGEFQNVFENTVTKKYHTNVDMTLWFLAARVAKYDTFATLVDNHKPIIHFRVFDQHPDLEKRIDEIWSLPARWALLCAHCSYWGRLKIKAEADRKAEAVTKAYNLAEVPPSEEEEDPTETDNTPLSSALEVQARQEMAYVHNYVEQHRPFMSQSSENSKRDVEELWKIATGIMYYLLTLCGHPLLKPKRVAKGVARGNGGVDTMLDGLMNGGFSMDINKVGDKFWDLSWLSEQVANLEGFSNLPSDSAVPDNNMGSMYQQHHQQQQQQQQQHQHQHQQPFNNNTDTQSADQNSHAVTYFRPDEIPEIQADLHCAVNILQSFPLNDFRGTALSWPLFIFVVVAFNPEDRQILQHALKGLWINLRITTFGEILGIADDLWSRFSKSDGENSSISHSVNAYEYREAVKKHMRILFA